MTGGGADYNNRLADRPEGTGFYWRDSIKLSFENALFYLFNPGVPSEVVYPSSIRAGNWLPGSDILKLDRPLSACLASLDERVVLRGTEAEEITPDTFSGSYYAYKLDRLLILLKHNDKPLLISVSWQKGKSDIGKKSGFIGDYDNWDFVYTKENGATKTGIGWADTYMYASCSVTLYFPDGPNNERTGYAVYRWLKAGWSGINMVEKQHLKDGMLRTLGGMKCVLESARRPDHKELSEKYRQLSAKSIEELSGLAAPYVQALQKNGADLDSDVEEVLKTGDYAGTLTKRQLVGMLMLNYVKEKLGKPVLE